MSLGWQTESALLPSKAKPIAVDGKSLVSLKAVIFDKEKKLEGSKLNDKYIRNKVKPHTHSNKNLFERPNLGVESRNAKDLRQEQRASKTNDIINAALKAKAELYDQIVSNSKLAESSSSNFLINFKDKPIAPSDRGVPDSQTLTTNRGKESSDCLDDDYIEITDSFGRSRRVSKRSSEYTEHVLEQNSKKIKFSMGTATHSRDSSHISSREHERYREPDEPSDPWAWSTGHNRADAGEWIEDAVRDRGMKALIEDRINHEIESTLNLSKGARIKTMWDKTLDSSAREYIDEIHDQVERERSQLARPAAGTDVKPNIYEDANAGSDHLKQSTSTRRSESDERKALLLKKLEERRAKIAS